MRLAPDIAVISECARPEKLRAMCDAHWLEREPVWIGTNPNKGLAVLAFNDYRVRLHEGYSPAYRYICPVHVEGPIAFNLLAVWAQNASAGIRRKRQPGPLRLAVTRYRDFLSERPGIIAGDWNNNVIWDRPGWRINQASHVRVLAERGLVSVYHEVMNEPQGGETIPTHYWRDRKRDGPTYHIDYIFVPETWLAAVRHFEVGGFDAWCGSGLSDHVPLIMDLEDPR